MNESRQNDARYWMERAIEAAIENVHQGGGPFAALVVKDGSCIARGTNRVTVIKDPTAHAEVMAIRQACAELGTFELGGCELYTSCEPCPMCLGAIYWARLDRIYYAGSREDAADAGFDDAHIYDELDRAPHERRITMEQILADEGTRAFEAWAKFDQRVEY